MTNLFTLNQSDVETGIFGFYVNGQTTTGVGPYSGGGVTIAQDTAQAWHATHSLKVVTDGTGTFQTVEVRIPVAGNFLAGAPYTLSAYIFTTGGGSVRCYLQSDTGNIGSVPTNTLTNGVWTRYTVTATLPTTLTQHWLALRVDTGGTAQALTFWIDGLQFELGSSASAWTPGSGTPTGGVTTLGVVGTSSTLNDLSVYKQQVVRVFSPAGAFIDVWRDAPLLAGFKDATNSAPTPLRVTLPRAFESFDEAGTSGARGTIAQGNIVQWWLYGPGLPANGQLRYQGYIDSYEPQIAENGEEGLTVTVTPFGSVLGDQGITYSLGFGTATATSASTAVTSTGVSTIVQVASLAGLAAPTYLSVDTSTSQEYVSVTATAAISTTSNTAVTATGSKVITPVSMAGIVVGTPLTCDTSTNQETVTVTAVTSTTFTATFAKTHAVNFVIVSNTITATFAKTHTTGFSVGGPIDPVIMFSYWFATTDTITSQPFTYPLTLDTGGSATSSSITAQYTFNNQGLLDIWTTILTLLQGDSPNWFFRVNPDKTVTLNKAPTTAQHAFIIGRHIAAPQYRKDWTQLKNVILVRGNGSISATAQGSDITTFDKRLLLFSDNRVTTQATATLLAQALLAQNDQMQIRTKLRIIDYRGDIQTGIGYDVETIKPGMTCQIIDPRGQTNAPLWDQAVWDSSYWDFAPGAALNQIVQIVSVAYNYDFVDLELAALQPNQDRTLIDLLNRFTIYTTN